MDLANKLTSNHRHPLSSQLFDILRHDRKEDYALTNPLHVTTETESEVSSVDGATPKDDSYPADTNPALPLQRHASRFSHTPVVEFRDVSFFYPSCPNKWVLRHLNLRVYPGTTVALLGASGCGKTTVLELLLRLVRLKAKQQQQEQRHQ